MTQANDVDIQELKDLIIRLDRKIDVGFANVDTKFSEVDKKIDVGFANVDTKFSEVDKKIDVGFANVDTKFSEVRGEIKDVRGDIKTLDARLNNLESNTKAIADLAEKVGELKNWKQIAIVIFTATVGGAIGWLVKTGK